MEHYESIKKFQDLMESIHVESTPEYGDAPAHERADREKTMKLIEQLIKDVRSEAGVYIKQEHNDIKLNKYLQKIKEMLLGIRAFQIGKPNRRDTMKDVEERLEKRL